MPYSYLLCNSLLSMVTLDVSFLRLGTPHVCECDSQNFAASYENNKHVIHWTTCFELDFQKIYPIAKYTLSVTTFAE